MLSPTELKLIAQFLDDYGGRLGNDGCNDYELDDTPEHRKLLEAAERTNSDDPDEWAKIEVYQGKLLTANFHVVGHLRARVLDVLNGKE